MPNHSKPQGPDAASSPVATAANVGLGFIVLCLFLYLLHAGAAITIPLVVAIFVWYLINALSRAFVGYGLTPKMGRSAAIILLLGGIWFVSSVVSADAAEVFRSASLFQKKLTGLLPDLLAYMPESVRPEPQDVAVFFNVSGFVKALVQSFTGFAGKSLIVIFYTGFFLYEQQFFGRKLSEMARTQAAEERVQNVLRNIDREMQHYISVKTFISIMAGLFTWGLMCAYGLAFAGFWGVMVFFFSFIPYFGPLAAVVLPGIVGVVQLGVEASFMPYLIGLAAGQTLWSGLIDRRLMHRRLNLSPIFVLLSLAVWTMIWGAPGMFLAVPILSTLVIIFSQFDRTRPVAVLMSRTGEVSA